MMMQKRKPSVSNRLPSNIRRWRWIAAIAAVISLGGLLLWLLNRNSAAANFTPEVTGAPSLTVSQETVDYGNVKMDTPVETVFRVRNVGDQALTFLREPQVEIVQGC